MSEADFSDACRMNPSLGERLKWGALGSSAPFGDRVVLARSLVYLFGAGGTVTLLSILFPHSSAADEWGVLVLSVGAYVAALVVLIGFDRLPMWGFNVIAAYGTLLITGGVYFLDLEKTPPVFYMWVGLFAFYFLPRKQAMAQVAFAVCAYGALLLAVGADGASLSVWFFITGTLFVMAVLMGALRGRLEGLIAQLGDAARRDFLTGLLNRRGFEERFDTEVERARRTQRPLSLLVGDLDHFKEVNDRLGHHAGDKALQELSSILNKSKRRVDVAARVGGEEFTLILPETDERRAYVVAERLRDRVRRTFAGRPVPITISIGVAGFPAQGESVEALLQAADQALYAAKELGRDRSVIFSEEIAGTLAETVAHGRSDHEGRLATLFALVEMLDARRPGAAEHSQAVARYAEMTAKELGVSADVVGKVRLAGVLHDVGKLGVPDSVLCKVESLTEQEEGLMRRHPEIAAGILDNAGLDNVREWVLDHQEHMDGGGYPRGLAGDAIPREARILAVADAYASLTDGWGGGRVRSQAQAVDELERDAGTRFDASVVEAFTQALERHGTRPRPQAAS